MHRKLYWDLNAVIDLLDSGRPRHEEAKALWHFCVMEEITIIISEDMLSTIYYVQKDKRKALDFFEVILREWEIVPFGKTVIEKAITLSKEKSVDFEDALQCFCAKEQECEALITHDRAFAACGIDAFGAQEFMELRPQ